MRQFLSQSISSLNKNKINGMLAEIDLRNTLGLLGFGGRISQGGWILRNVGPGFFGHHTVVVFPETILPTVNYEVGRTPEPPPASLHTICSTMHQIGVRSYHCVPSILLPNDTSSVTWQATQLGIPDPSSYAPLLTTITSFTARERNYNFLRYHADPSVIPEASVPEEFTKEHLRISLQSAFMTEISDIDGIIWGQQYTYPIEIKEKTAAADKKLGDYFGLDVGPFVKLAFYAAKKGNLHSLFFVREINNTEERALVDWWFITFDTIAQFASWNPQGGGTNMQGGGSTVVKIPKAEFTRLSPTAFEDL